MHLQNTERNNPGNIQHECLLNFREVFICTLRDFTCMLLSETVQDIKSTVQDSEIKCNPVNSTAFSY